MSRSTDAGLHWTEPAAINQTNPLYGTHYGGSGRTQGIELARGPHKGRLVIAKIGSLAAERPAKGRAPTHAFAMYDVYAGRRPLLAKRRVCRFLSLRTAPTRTDSRQK